MIRIESTSNSIFKQTKKLLSSSNRRKTGMFLVEGERIVKDALSLGAQMEYILLSETYQKTAECDFDGQRVYILTDKLFDELKSTVNTQGIMAVSKYIDSPYDEINYNKGLYLYLDSVADPGNMGTIIRSAAAFGVDGIVLSKGCVDVFNPKVIRSTMSGIFSAKLYFDKGNILEEFRDNGYQIIGTFPSDAVSSRDFCYSDKCIIVMGNEANGICLGTEKMCTHRVSIPMTEDAESLNVSVACGILLYEAYTKTKGA